MINQVVTGWKIPLWPIILLWQAFSGNGAISQLEYQKYTTWVFPGGLNGVNPAEMIRIPGIMPIM